MVRVEFGPNFCSTVAALSVYVSHKLSPPSTRLLDFDETEKTLDLCPTKGTYEIDDYAQVIKEITKRDYADGSKVGVYGHSYGGYATALLMLRYPELFHVGVSGAPVSDWRSYDTIYTERYMDTPQRNKIGYDEGSAMTYAEHLKGKLMN